MCYMANKNLANAKKAKNDEFYTQFSDIQKLDSLTSFDIEQINSLPLDL